MLPNEIISSRRNPLIRRITKLDADPAERAAGGCFLLWGLKLVEEGLREPERLERIIASDRVIRLASSRGLLREARRSGVEVTAAEESLLEDLLPGSGHQGWIAIARQRLESIETLSSGKRDSVFLVVDRVQDPGNLGTMARVGEAAGIAGLVVVPGTVDPYNTRSVRASAGSLLRLPVVRAASAADLLAIFRKLGIRIFVSLSRGGMPCHRADLKGSIALVVGNEGEGVGPDWVDAADRTLTVPLEGGTQSLNVALAAAILLYETARQRERP